ncbi:hypothetical protein HPB52_006214 [Rhipicephalus sanguineus]|uniref:Uncharacterized protein n=1 Tax=Rhipicephalus sanguineus TaxID=34632 RepID=A0A9D4QHY1_RHISA|nr:hypothetical protein HPB52_006214 [Rhipicephalus sanguineus]
MLWKVVVWSGFVQVHQLVERQATSGHFCLEAVPGAKARFCAASSKRRRYYDGEGPRTAVKDPVDRLSDFSAPDVGGFRQASPADGSPSGCGA